MASHAPSAVGVLSTIVMVGIRHPAQVSHNRLTDQELRGVGGSPPRAWLPACAVSGAQWRAYFTHSGAGLEAQAGQGEFQCGAELVDVVVAVELVHDLVDEREFLGVEFAPGLGEAAEEFLAGRGAV